MYESKSDQYKMRERERERERCTHIYLYIHELICLFKTFIIYFESLKVCLCLDLNVGSIESLHFVNYKDYY